MTDNNQITQLLLYLLVFMVFVLFILIGVLVFVKIKDNQKKKDEESNTEDEKGAIMTSNTATKGYNKQSIMTFMEFDKVEDNMIVQKNGNKYLMVVECQGVNYDLMSEMEQTAVEEGFIQFLNSLRYPIQIYVQTRKVNLEGSISNYNKRINEIEAQLRRREATYESNRTSGLYTKDELRSQFYELTKLRNLYEYGKDIIFNTQQMSLNKNVLNKQYYIITSFYPSDIGNENFDKDEMKSIAFSELYTRCQSIISALSASGVGGKILDSNALVELLYMAYNRDEAEVFGLDKALNARYDELYSTAPEVIDKKIAALDKEIREKAEEKAQQVVEEVVTEKERKLQERKNRMDDIIGEMARMIINENEPYIGKEVAKEANEKITNEREQRANKKTSNTKGTRRARTNEKEENINGQKTVKKAGRTIKTA